MNIFNLLIFTGSSPRISIWTRMNSNKNNPEHLFTTRIIILCMN